MVERLKHYFQTYKLAPGAEVTTSLRASYGHDHAERVIAAATEDYIEEFGAEPQV